VLLSRAHTMVGSPSGSLGLIDQALEHSDQAVAHARAAGLDPPAYPLGRIAFMLRHRGRDTEAIDWTSRAEAAALTEHDEETLLMARWVRALALTDLGRHREAWQTLDSIAEIGKGEEVFWHARVPNTYGSILADLGLFDRALDRDLESLEVASSSTAMPIREAELQTLLNLAADYLGLGRAPEAHARLEAVRRQADEVEYGRFRWLNRLHFLDAEVALVEGDAERGRVAADRCLELAATYGQAKYEVRGKIARARALAALDARPTALLEARAAGRQAAHSCQVRRGTCRSLGLGDVEQEQPAGSQGPMPQARQGACDSHRRSYRPPPPQTNRWHATGTHGTVRRRRWATASASGPVAHTDQVM
jgi:tetratricopeptide (TPR) repeat protein